MSDRPRFDLLIRHDLSIDALRAAIKDDPVLRAEAEAELKAAAAVEKRCVMSKEYAAALREALV